MPKHLYAVAHLGIRILKQRSELGQVSSTLPIASQWKGSPSVHALWESGWVRGCVGCIAASPFAYACTCACVLVRGVVAFDCRSARPGPPPTVGLCVSGVNARKALLHIDSSCDRDRSSPHPVHAMEMVGSKHLNCLDFSCSHFLDAPCLSCTRHAWPAAPTPHL